MPTLNWIGKEKVINHHRDVPFKILEHKYGFNEKDGQIDEPVNSGNKIIHGDNLEALKSLLPEYEGKIKCIYIDPPYNTGNENWVYNDNVNHPKIKKWLGEVVGKDADDLTRHDKWLCMMYPRLHLLHKLISPDGFIFVSLDDNEIFNLKFILDEIFGANNFQAIISVQSNKRGHTYKQIAKTHEYLICYSKSEQGNINELPQEVGNFQFSDNIGDFSIRELRNRNPKFGRFNRPNLFYPVYINPIPVDEYGFCPISLIKSDLFSIEIFPLNSKSEESCWRWGKDKLKKNVKTECDTSVLIGKQKQDRSYGIYEKYRKATVKSKTIWDDTEVISEQGTSLLRKLDLGNLFQFPKPLGLIEKVLLLSTNINSIVLDSFAGSATTAHGVLSLNNKDGGNRKFILIEMEDYANSVTAERIKRVIKGYGNNEGITGNFNYYELGKPLFTGENNEFLNEEVETSKIREYIWYSETRKAFEQTDNKVDSKHFLGKKEGTAYYFIYEKESLTTLDYDSLSTIKTKAGQYVIYADNCLLPKDFMMKNNIVFKKIPRDITRF